MFYSANLELNKYNPWKPPALVATAAVIAGLITIGMALGLGLGIGLNNDEQNLIPITDHQPFHHQQLQVIANQHLTRDSFNIFFSLSYQIVNTSLITSIFSNFLSISNPTYSPPHQPIPGHFYDAIRLTVATSGNYTIRSSSVTGTNLYGYLYINNFDPFNPSSNLIASDDNNGGNQQFIFTVALQSTFTTSKTNKYYKRYFDCV